MKTTTSILILLTAALFCAASPQPLPAADVVVDISSFAPRDPEVVLRQIELNVAIKQYEKVLLEAHEADLQRKLGPTETGLTDVQEKQWRGRAENKLKCLEDTAVFLRERISNLVSEAKEKMAGAFEKEHAQKMAKPIAEPHPPKEEPRG